MIPDSVASPAPDLFQFVSGLFGPNPETASAVLERAFTRDWSDETGAMVRLSALRPVNDWLWFYRLNNLWSNAGRPPLKPGPARRKVLLLADYTANQLSPLVNIMSASRGVHIELEFTEFDSVEQEILNPSSRTYAAGYDLIIIALSPQWLRRYLGDQALVDERALEAVKQMIATLVGTLTDRIQATILVTNFAAPALGFPAGQVVAGGRIGWNLAVADVNGWLARAGIARMHVVDVARALYDAGGSAAAGLSSHLRAGMAFEPAGTVAVARELASAIAHVCGKTHRALVTDWDNTLWGGEVADLGSGGIVCGSDSPDAMGFRMVQEFVKGLKPLGILLAAASRNDRAVENVFDENPELPLRLSDFAAVELDLGPKSRAIENISKSLVFGSEYMLFLEDSLFDIAEVLSVHPFIDIVHAGPDAASTLNALSHARFFNTIALSEEDLGRSAAASTLKDQKVLRAAFTNLDDFLSQIQIALTNTGANEANLGRIEQLFQKTNQFNLTTRRYTAGHLARLKDEHATVTAFSYKDTFGPQGIIAVVVLRDEGREIRVDSWLMSCRVLNRTVEEAVFEWILRQSGGKAILGEYRPTEKNALVRDLYARLGFRFVSRDQDTGDEFWRLEAGADRPQPRHFVRLSEELTEA